MTDLQTDIEYLEQQFLNAGQSKSHEMRAVLEAARLVADPPPRTELIEDFVTELLRGTLINQNSSNIEGEIRSMVGDLTSRWDAALTPGDTETDDG